VIAATNVDLKEAIQQKRFRADLYHRLNVLEIAVPPLRRRTGDIPLLAAHFLRKFGTPRGVGGIEPDAMKALIGGREAVYFTELDGGPDAKRGPLYL